MSWILARLSGKTDSILTENPEISEGTDLYPSISQSETHPTPSLPYAIQPTPTISNNTNTSTNVLPHTLDDMKIKFKFLYDSNMEDVHMNQIIHFINKTKQTSRDIQQLISEIDNIDFALERSVIQI
ncbi:uncharacterized protein LOC103508180 isoform X2 [Diaphorina citri]|nr:uncharacterized protein LOC103508180 isoform X2 [Diaphorina citri]KAI5695493.1 hypothetical protein M8J77_024741 [Diaphorina citri]KAI5711365.1 hypothetical protein M8J75_016464 [Diaphorina citri]KAI5745618.1 hypothetical protein M8J76_012794 [Diaphorina citri]KAI5751973.1 hypothetical protein M8J77_012587 [Diaphorina citri]